MMWLAKPDPGTTWEFDRGRNPLLTGPIPTFNLVDTSTGRVLGRVYPEASLTKLGVWFDSWELVRYQRRRRRKSAMYDSLEAEYRDSYLRLYGRK